MFHALKRWFNSNKDRFNKNVSPGARYLRHPNRTVVVELSNLLLELAYAECTRTSLVNAVNCFSHEYALAVLHRAIGTDDKLGPVAQWVRLNAPQYSLERCGVPGFSRDESLVHQSHGVFIFTVCRCIYKLR